MSEEEQKTNPEAEIREQWIFLSASERNTLMFALGIATAVDQQPEMKRLIFELARKIAAQPRSPL